MIKVNLLDDYIPGDTVHIIGWNRRKYFYAVLENGEYTELCHWQIDLKKTNKCHSLPYDPLGDVVPTRRESSREIKRETSSHKATYYVNVYRTPNEIVCHKFKTLKRAFSFIRRLTHDNWTLSANFYRPSSTLPASIADGRGMTLFNLIGLPVSRKTVKRELEKIQSIRSRGTNSAN